MGYVPARRLVANKVYLLCSLLAHNLSRELQMQVEEPVRGTTQKRTVKWLFEELDTLRRTIVARAGRLTRPQGKLTLTLNANPIVQDALLRFPRQNQRLQTHLGKKTLGVNPAVKGQGARGGFLVGGLYHHQLSPALQTLALNPEGIQYYAHSVIKSEIFQVTRRNDPDRYLHVIAFIAHQYFRLRDNLVDVLLTSLRSFQNGALRAPRSLTLIVFEDVTKIGIFSAVAF